MSQDATQPKYCPNCGQPNPIDAPICSNCGHDLPTSDEVRQAWATRDATGEAGAAGFEPATSPGNQPTSSWESWTSPDRGPTPAPGHGDGDRSDSGDSAGLRVDGEPATGGNAPGRRDWAGWGTPIASTPGASESGSRPVAPAWRTPTGPEPAAAQGYGEPVHGQPVYDQPGYAQPPYAQPGSYSQPGADPGYGQSPYGQQPYGQPGYGQPGYEQSVYGQDQWNQGAGTTGYGPGGPGTPGAPPPVAPPAGMAKRGPSGCLLGALGVMIVGLVAAALIALLIINAATGDQLRDELRDVAATEASEVGPVDIPPDGRLVVTEADLNRSIRQYADFGAIDDPTVNIAPDGLELNFSTLGVASTWRAGLAAEDGRVVLTDPSAEGLASRVLDADDLVTVVEPALNDILRQSGVIATNVELADGELTVVTAPTAGATPTAGTPVAGGTVEPQSSPSAAPPASAPVVASPSVAPSGPAGIDGGFIGLFGPSAQPSTTGDPALSASPTPAPSSAGSDID